MVEQNKQHIKNLKNLFVQLKWQALAQQIPIKTSTQADSELRSVRCESKFCKQQYAPSFFYIHFLGSEWIPRTEFNSNESFAFRMLKHSIAFGVNANWLAPCDCNFEWIKNWPKTVINHNISSFLLTFRSQQSGANVLFSSSLTPIRLAGIVEQLKCKWNSKWPSTFYYLTLLPICLTQNSNEIDCVVARGWVASPRTHVDLYGDLHVSYAAAHQHHSHRVSNNGKFNIYCYANSHTI